MLTCYFIIQVLTILKDCKCDRNKLKTKACGNGAFIISDGWIRGERKLYARVCIVVHLKFATMLPKTLLH